MSADRQEPGPSEDFNVSVAHLNRTLSKLDAVNAEYMRLIVALREEIMSTQHRLIERLSLAVQEHWSAV